LGTTRIVDRFWHLMQHGDAASLRALLDADCRLYENGRLAVAGREPGVEHLLCIRGQLRGLSVRIHERLAAGARVLERWTLHAQGTEASRAPLVVHGASWTVCEGGRIVEIRQWWDAASVRRQLADAPAPAAPTPPAFEGPRPAPGAT
jgi:limonene-1,2-epoxide hydrolase